MVPGASSPARAIASPRATTSWIPWSKPREPLATRAVYSPRLWPAQAAGVRPMRSTASSTTRLSTVVANWAFSVWVSSSIGACSSRWERSRSAAAEASSTTSHEGWSTHGSPIPARCDPCPGKVKTNTCPTAPIDGGLRNPQCGMPARLRPRLGAGSHRRCDARALDQRSAGYPVETRYDARCDPGPKRPPSTRRLRTGASRLSPGCSATDRATQVCCGHRIDARGGASVGHRHGASAGNAVSGRPTRHGDDEPVQSPARPRCRRHLGRLGPGLGSSRFGWLTRLPIGEVRASGKRPLDDPEQVDGVRQRPW